MRKKIVLLMVMGLASGGGVWAALTDGLVAYWPLEGNLADDTGNGHDGTSSGGLSYIPGKIDQAVRFDGNWGTGVQTGTWDPGAVNGQFSISCWARHRLGGASRWQGLVGKRNSWDRQEAYWYIEMDETEDRTARNGLYFASPEGSAWTNQALDADQWRHVVATYDSSGGRLYVDGVQVATDTTWTLDAADSGNYLVFGCVGHDGTNWENPFNGDLDEIGIWDRALNPAEITELYNGGDGVSLAGLPWQAVYIAPADRATGIPIAGTKLQWTTGEEESPGPIVRYDVYLSRNSKEVSDANDTVIVGSVSGSVFEYNTGALAPGSTYYWSVASVVDDVNVAFGKVWRFDTQVMIPVITQQPVNVSVGPGGWTVSFHVGATSADGDISYKWYKRGSAGVLGTTDTLTVTASDSAAGQYYCDLTNDYNPTTPVRTNDAELTIVRLGPAGLLTGIVGYWPLDGSAADASGNGHNGTVAGDAAFIPGKIGGGISTDGQGDYVEIADNPQLDLTNAITVATWAKVRSLRHQWQSIVCKGETSWRMQRDSLNRGIEWALGYWETYGGVFGPTQIDDGKWHLFVGMTDGTTESLYVDGALDATHTRIGPTAVQANDFGIRIGSNPETTTRDFDGWLDETIVWNRALSAAEVSSLYAGGQGVTLVSDPWRPTGPNPDGTVWIDPDVNLALSWQAGRYAPFGAQYQVYFGETGGVLALKGTTTNLTFTISAADMEFDKFYSWRVDTSSGGSTETGNVWTFETIKKLPLPVTQPVNVVVSAGGEATFTFQVSSDTDVSYAWYRAEDNSPAGTGNPLVLTGVTSASEGYYYCIATNNAGSLQSDPVSLMLEQLIAHWDMDDVISAGDTGAAVIDLTKFGHDGVEQGEVHSTDGIIDAALAFDGAGDLVDIGTWNPNERSAGITIALWARWAGLNGQYQGLIAKRDTWAAGSMMWQIELNIDSGSLSFAREGSSLPGVGALPIGEWAFVAVTFDGTTARTYRDGVEVTSGAFSFGTGTGAHLVIGSGQPDGGNPFNGDLDDVRIYNYALGPIEVARLYQQTAGGRVCVWPVAYDLDGNCRLDLNDFAMIAAEWADCGLVPASACR